MGNVKLYHREPLSLDLIEETFKASFQVDFDRDYWEWRFLNNPNSDKTYISYIVENGKLAAYYAVSPMQLCCNSSIFDIALSNMTMTHPDFRGKGYFLLLAKALYANLKEDGFVGVYGFANHNSHYGFRKYLDWQDLSVLNLFSATKEEFRKDATHDKLIFRKESVTLQNLKEAESLSSCSNGTFHVNRDLKNLRWRVLDNPINKYYSLNVDVNSKTEMVLIYKSFGAEIDILEVFYRKGDASNNLLIEAITFLFHSGETKINLWSHLNSPEHLILEKYGFRETHFNTYFGIIPFTENKEMLEYKNWHYRFLDSDIF